MQRKYFLIITVLFSLILFIGCAAIEMTPRKDFLFHPKELVDAERALKEARAAGKDKECPQEFKAVENLVDKAFETYRACRTKEAIEIAKDAMKKADALCPKPAPAPKPAPPPPPPAPKVIDRLTLRINFDFDKSVIRQDQIAELQKAVNFVKKYPGAKIILEGHTCNLGTDDYNQALSERRAESVKRYLIQEGAAKELKISTIGYGESRPVASNDTEAGRAQNRRVEVFILSE
ncbi:MAG: OmpA family protein [Nitrospirae bacterium]|nr:OmpA family protein [Nitrospirota bacterium]